MNISLFIQRLTSIFSPSNQLEEKSTQPGAASISQRPIQDDTPNQHLFSQTIEREIRAQRTFTLAEAIGREGSSFMKGESAIPRPLKAIAQINHFITDNLPNPASPLSEVLKHWAKEDIRVSRYLDAPLTALAQIIQSLLNEPSTFQEFFRQVAIAQSQLTGERPHFQRPNHPPHPDAVYSHASVQHQLSNLLLKLQQELNLQQELD